MLIAVVDSAELAFLLAFAQAGKIACWYSAAHIDCKWALGSTLHEHAITQKGQLCEVMSCNQLDLRCPVRALRALRWNTHILISGKLPTFCVRILHKKLEDFQNYEDDRPHPEKIFPHVLVDLG